MRTQDSEEDMGRMKIMIGKTMWRINKKHEKIKTKGGERTKRNRKTKKDIQGKQQKSEASELRRRTAESLYGLHVLVTVSDQAYCCKTTFHQANQHKNKQKRMREVETFA